MTQEERWMTRLNEVMEYMTTHKRNLSKYDLDIRHLYTWVKHNRKLLKAGKMAPERVELMVELVDLWEERKIALRAIDGLSLTKNQSKLAVNNIFQLFTAIGNLFETIVSVLSGTLICQHFEFIRE